MKRGVPVKRGAQPSQSNDIDVEQLKQLVEIQTEIVKQARQIEHAKKSRGSIRRKLVESPRRLIGFISTLVSR